MKCLSGIISLCFLLSTGGFAAEQVSFASKPLTAGRASLTENGFIVSSSLGTANFSPDLRYPIQLIYQSASEKTGIFGFAWSSPQLESSACYDKDGILWTTLWGEKIKFFPKDVKTDKDAVQIELYEAAKEGRGFYAPYSDWEADTNVSSKKFAQNGDWSFFGKNGYEGWEFTYRDAQLHKIKAPSGRSIDFSYAKGLLTKISQDGQPFVEISYDKNLASTVIVNGIEQQLSYADTPVVIMPGTLAGKTVTISRPMPLSIRTGDLNPVEFAYQSGYLSQVKQGGFTDEFTVQTETQAERYANLQSKDRKSGVRHSGKVAGRLLADSSFQYGYKDGEPGQVRLTNKLKQKADYDYSAKTGVFKIDEFSGKSYTVYYFMRYDVAYLGKVRKIVDDRDRGWRAEGEAARALIGKGCVIIGQHADSTGAPSEVQAQMDAGKVAYSVGYNIDMLSVAPKAALTSSQNNWAALYTATLDKFLKGEAIPKDLALGYADDAVMISALGESCAAGTAEKVAEVIAGLKDGSLQVFDTANFTVKGEKVTTYLWQDTDGDFVGDSGEAIVDGIFQESVFRSAPYFGLRIDGITELN